MNKTLGLVLLTVGLGMTAGFGAFLAPAYRSALVLEGEATFSDAAVDDAFAAYCNSREENRLGASEGCADSPGLVNQNTADGMSKAELRGAQVAALDANKNEVLLVDVAMARVQYKLALKKSQQLWSAAEGTGTQGPGARLSGWLGQGGLGFGFGLFMLALGAWTCRKADQSALVDDAPTDAGPVDFGVLLERVRTDMESLSADMNGTTTPTVDGLEAFKQRLENIQKDEMARLCACGSLVQRRYGLQGMAALFSPLSSAERKMNRAWAALVDRHWPESLASMGGALDDLQAAHQELKTLQVDVSQGLAR